MSKFLSYGDMVIISFIPADINSKKGIVYSDGFLENDVFLKDDNQIFETNFKNSIFQLFPWISHESNTETHNSLKGTLSSSSSTSDDFYNSWNNNLDHILNKFHGRPILYGDHIQFLHLESKSFIKVVDCNMLITKYSPIGGLSHNLGVNMQSVQNNVQVNNSNIGYKFILENEIDNDNYFQILCVSNYFQNGEKVSYDSKFYLKSLLTNQMLGSTSMKSLQTLTIPDKDDVKINILNSPGSGSLKSADHKSPMPIRSNVKHQSDIINTNNKGKLSEICVTTEPCMISFNLYCTFKLQQQYERDKTIKNGDFVKLYDQRLIKDIAGFHKYYLMPRKIKKNTNDYILVLAYDSFINNTKRDKNDDTANTLVSFNSIYQIIESNFEIDEIQPVRLIDRKLIDKASNNNANNNTNSTITNILNTSKYLLKHLVTSQFIKNASTIKNPSDLMSNNNQESVRLCTMEWLPEPKTYKNIDEFCLSIVSSKPIDKDSLPLAEDNSLLIGTFQITKTPINPHKKTTIANISQDSLTEVRYFSQSRTYFHDTETRSEPEPQKPLMISKNDIDEHKIYEIEWKPETNMTECLKFDLVSDEEMYVINYLSSFNRVLNNLLINLKRVIKKQGNTNLENNVNIILREIDDHLSKILAFLLDKKTYDPELEYRVFEISKIKQSLIRELKIIDQINQILHVICEYFIIFTKTEQFTAFNKKFCQFLILSIIENTHNTLYLSKYLKFYLKPALLNQMVPLIYEVINSSEYGSLGFITEILNTFIFDSSLSYFQIGTELSINILRVIICAVKYKTFCLSLQRYKTFWQHYTIEKIFPQFKLPPLNNESSPVKAESESESASPTVNFRRNNNLDFIRNSVEIYLDNKKICNLSDLKYKEFPSGNLKHDYIIYSLELLVVLSKTLPNFLRLYSSLSHLVPYDLCLLIIDPSLQKPHRYNDEEEKHMEKDQLEEQEDNHLSYRLKYLILEIIIHFHYKYFTSKKIIWSNKLIRMITEDGLNHNSRSNISNKEKSITSIDKIERDRIEEINDFEEDNKLNKESFNQINEEIHKSEEEDDDQLNKDDMQRQIQEILLGDLIIQENQIPEKVRIIDIFNLYYKQFKQQNFNDIMKNDEALANIKDLLELINLFLKNKIIKFSSKTPYLVLYKELFSLFDLFQNKDGVNSSLSKSISRISSNYTQAPVSRNSIRIKEKNIKIQLSKLLHEMLLNINNSIEDFFSVDFLKYFLDKGGVTNSPMFQNSTNNNNNGIKNTITLENIPNSNNNNNTDTGINTNNNNSISTLSKNTLKDDKIIEKLEDNKNKNNNITTIATNNNNNNNSNSNIATNKTNFEFAFENEITLEDFITQWDQTLNQYRLSMVELINDELRFALVDGIQVSTLQNLELLTSRFQALVKKMEDYVIIENHDEFYKVFRLMKLSFILQQTIEILIKEGHKNQIKTNVYFNKIHNYLNKFLETLELDLTTIHNLNEFYEKLTNKNDIFIPRNTRSSKFQDVLRILGIHEILMEVLDFHINFNPDDYDIEQRKNFQNILNIIKILVFFVTNHTQNSIIIYKLITTAYFYDIFGKREYPTELILYLQFVISRAFSCVPDFSHKKEEQFKIFDVFFKPFLSQSITVLIGESPDTTDTKISCNSENSNRSDIGLFNSLTLPKTEPRISVLPAIEKVQYNNTLLTDREDLSHSQFLGVSMNKSGQTPSPRTPIAMINFKSQQEYCKTFNLLNITLNNLDGLLNNSFNLIIHSTFPLLNKILNLSFIALEAYITNNGSISFVSSIINKLLFSMSESERYNWFNYFYQLINIMINWQNSKKLIIQSIYKQIPSLQTIILLINRLKISMPLNLRQALFRIGQFMYLSSLNNTASLEGQYGMMVSENIKDKIMFIFLNLIEFEIYFTAMKSKNSESFNLQEIRKKLMQLQLCQDYMIANPNFNLDLISLFNILDNDEQIIKMLREEQTQIKQYMKNILLPFFKDLIKYDVSICLLNFELAQSTPNNANANANDHEQQINSYLNSSTNIQKALIISFILDYINCTSQIMKEFNDDPGLNYVKKFIYHEIKNNKQYGKYHQQMKFLDHFSKVDTASYMTNPSSEYKLEAYSLNDLYYKTIEKYFKVKEKTCLNANISVKLLAQILEKHQEERTLFKKFLELIQKHDEISFKKSNKSFLYMLLHEIITNKIEAIQNMREKFEYRLSYIRIIQQQLLKNNLTSFLFEGLVTCTESELNLILELAIKYLFGGCYEIQQSFYEQFGMDQENRVIYKLNAIFKKNFEKLANREKIRNKSNFVLILSDKPIKDEYFGKKVNMEAEHTIIVNILYFIQLLCENHNSKFQHFFHEQIHQNHKISTISVNFPIELCNYFKLFVGSCNFNTYTVGRQLLNTLTEIIQGKCRNIIKEICSKTNIIDDILEFLNKYKAGDEKLAQIFGFLKNPKYLDHLRNDAITLLLSILESSDYETKLKIGSQIDCKKLLLITENLLANFFKLKGLTILKKDILLQNITDKDFAEKGGGFLDGLNMFIVINVLEEYSFEFSKNISIAQESLNSETRNNLMLYQNEISNIFIRSIEIVDEEKNLRKIYFAKNISCFFLTKKIRQNIIDKIVRTNYFSKITEFFGYTDEVLYKIVEEHKAFLNQSKKSLNELNKLFKKMSYALAFILNILLLLYFDNNDLTIIIEDRYHTWDSIFYYLLNLLQLVSSLLIFITWFWTNEPQFLLKAKWGEFIKENANKIDPITFVEEERWQLRPESITENDFERILLTKGPDADELKFNNQRAFQLPKIKKLYYRKKISFILSSKAVITNIIYVISCALSLTIHPIFCSWQLLNTLAESKIMQSVFYSFYKNGAELGITFLFGLIIIFMYSLVGFFFLKETFIIESYENVCTTVWHCFISIIDFGLRSGGGIGDVLKKESYIHGNSTLYTARWFYDLSFFVLIIIIMLSLIFGIVIDTFSYIRVEKLQNVQDQITKCFICGIERGLLETIGNGFQQHIRYEHYMWDYMFYILHLEVRGIIDLSEIEAYVYKSYKNKNYSWIPYSRALCMKQDEHNEHNEHSQSKDIDLSEINAQNMEIMDKLNGRLDQILEIIQEKDWNLANSTEMD